MQRLRLLAVTTVILASLAPLLASTSAQQTRSSETEAQYLGGFNPRACRYPTQARSAALSGCCQMELDIDAKGKVLQADGECSDPIFLEPTKRCLAAQSFMPATRNGQPVRAMHHLEYEWRASIPSRQNLCNKLKTS